MKTLVCYRVEHKETCRGPLAEGIQFHWFAVAREHEGPYDWDLTEYFGNDKLPKNYIFGTKTKKCIKSIFRGWLAKDLLESNGFYLYRMKVEAKKLIRCPDGQVMFPRESVVSKEKIEME